MIKYFQIQNGQGEFVKWTTTSNLCCITKAMPTKKYISMALTPEPLSKNPNAGYFWGADVCLLIADAWRWEQKKSAHACSEGRISQNEGMRAPGMIPTASKAPTPAISIFYLLLQVCGTKQRKDLVYRKLAPLSLSCSLWKSVNLVFSENTCTPYLTQHKEPINSSLRDIWQSYKKWGEKCIPLKKC